MNIKIQINVNKLFNFEAITLPIKVDIVNQGIFTTDHIYVTSMQYLDHMDKELLRIYKQHMTLIKISKHKLHFLLDIILENDKIIPSYLMYYIMQMFRREIIIKHTSTLNITEDIKKTEQIKKLTYYPNNIICVDDNIIDLNASKIINKNSIKTINHSITFYTVFTDFEQNIFNYLHFDNTSTIALIPEDWDKSCKVTCIRESEITCDTFKSCIKRILIFISDIDIPKFNITYNNNRAALWLFVPNIKLVCQQDPLYKHSDYSLKNIKTCLSLYKLNEYKPVIKIIKHKTDCTKTIIAPFKRKFDAIKVDTNSYIECPICLEQKQVNFVSNTCNHKLCFFCWKTANNLNNDKRILCPICRADMNYVTYNTPTQMQFNDKIETINKLLNKYTICTFITNNEKIQFLLTQTLIHSNYNFYPSVTGISDCYIFLHPSLNAQKDHNSTYDIELMSSLTNNDDIHFYFLIEENNFEDKIFDEIRIKKKKVFVF